MRTKPHAGFGLEISDVDLRTIDGEAFTTIRALFAEHGLLVFRGQQLGEEDHIAFAERFGTINVNRFFEKNVRHPEIARVAKEPHHRLNVGGGWHTDHSYDEEPALGSILVARELPHRGGDTWFVSMTDAFDRLPEAVKSRLRRMRAVHSAKHIFGSKAALLRRLIGAEQAHNSQLADAMEAVVHPVVIRHPLSGREALYVNPAFTIRFEHWGLLRSLPLLGYLYWHTTREPHVAKLRWKPGTVAIWDNRSTWHFARNDYPGQRRVMDRITIEGCALTPSGP